MKLSLRPFQTIGARHLAGRRRAYLGDQMGLGKTPQAVCAADGTAPQGRILIIAPLATALGWVRECQRWSTPCSILQQAQIVRRKTPIPTTGPCCCIIPWTDVATRLPDLLQAEAWDILICDEAHRLKGGTKVAMSRAITGTRRKVKGAWTAEKGLADHAQHVWCLSGTPMPNGRPIELHPALQMLGAIGPGQPWACRNQYLEHCKQPNRWTPAGFDYLGANGMDRYNRRLAESGVMLRREAGDVAGELPDIQRSIVPLSVTDALPEEDRVRVIAAAKERRSGLPAFEDMSEYRAEMGKRKSAAAAAWVAEWLDDAGPDSAIVVFVWHKEVGRTIADALNKSLDPQGRHPSRAIQCATGDDDVTARQGKVNAFADPAGPRVLVASIAACGTGMDGMQKRTSVCCFAETPWSPEHADQAEGRIRRMGAGAQAATLAQAHYLVADESLDRHIAETVNGKRELITAGLGDETAGPERSATAAPVAPPPPEAPAPAPEPAPAPSSVAWKWTRDKDTDTWLAACWEHQGDAEGWAGSVVTITASSGAKRRVMLQACTRHGISRQGTPYSVWRVEAIADPADEHRRSVGYLGRRAQGRGLTADNAPLAADEMPAAQAAHEAARHLTLLDTDRASVRNSCGWSQADGTIGRILADTPAEHWNRGTLALARALLSTYRRTQLPPNLCNAVWPC